MGPSLGSTGATAPPPPTTVSTETSRAAVTARGLVKVYGGGDARVTALDGVSVAFAYGTFTAITRRAARTSVVSVLAEG